MPSTSHNRRLLTVILLVCVCSSTVTAAVTGPRPATATSACYPGVDAVDRDEAVGDVVELEMLLCFSGSVHVEGPGYTGNATLGDGNRSGQITLRLNTYRNGTGAFNVTSDVLDSVPMNATGNGSFQPGNYTVTVRGWSGDVVETVTFELDEPRARNLSVFRAPRGGAANLRSIDDVREARAVSRVDSHRQFDDANSERYLPLATNETLVVAVRVDGVEGAMAAANGTPLARFRTAIRETNAVLATRQTYETVTPERQPLLLDLLNSSGTHLVSHPANDTYYLVVDTRELWGEWEGTHGGPIHVGSHAGMGFAVRFSMQGPISEDDPPADLVAADFRVVEAAVGFPRLAADDSDDGDGRPVLAPDRDARLLARSTMAPGTTLMVRVAGLPDGPIERRVQVESLPDGPGFQLPLNLSGVQNGTVLTLTVQRGNDALDERLEVVVRTPQATLEVRPQSSTASFRVYSLTVSHPSVVAVYAENGSLAGTAAVNAGSTVGLSVPLRTDNGTYRVVLYRDVDRSGSLTRADEAYRQDGGYVEATVDVGATESTSTPTPTSTPTRTTGIDESRSPAGTSPTEQPSPGFSVLVGVIGLLLAMFAFRRTAM